MRKQIFSLTLEPETIEVIERVARENGITKSAVARNLLELIAFLPPAAFRKKSQLPGMLNLNKGVNNEK